MLQVVRESSEILRKLFNNEMGLPKGKKGLRRREGRKRWAKVGVLKRRPDRRGYGPERRL